MRCNSSMTDSNFEKEEKKLEKVLQDSEKDSAKAEKVADGADHLVEAMTAQVEKMVKEHPEILEKMNPEEREKFNTTINKIKKRMVNDHSSSEY